MLLLSLTLPACASGSWKEAAALADSTGARQAAYDAAIDAGSFEEISRAAGAARHLAGQVAAAFETGEPDPPEESRSALVEAAIFAARWGEGNAVLASFGKRDLEDTRLLLLLGRLERERGERRAAASRFEKAVARRDSILAETAAFLAGTERAATGEHEAAEALLARATSPAKTGLWHRRACEALAWNALAWGRPERALAWLDSLDYWSREYHPADSLAALGIRARAATGDTARAIGAARWMLSQNRGHVEAVDYLLRAGVPLEAEEYVAAGGLLAGAGRVDEAVAMADSATARHWNGGRWVALGGEWLRKARRYADARERFERVLASPSPMDEARDTALLGIARTWRSERVLDRMEAAYRRAAREAVQAEERANAFAELARELDEAGRRSEALALYRSVRDGYGASGVAGDARFAIGFIHWREGRRAEAATAFATARDRADSDAARNRALVWLAKTRVAAADRDSARALLAQASRSDDFYGVAAAALLGAGEWSGGSFVRTLLEARPAPERPEAHDLQRSPPGDDALHTGSVVNLLLDLGFDEESAWLLSGRGGDWTASAAQAARRDSPLIATRAGVRSYPGIPRQVAERFRFPVAWAEQVDAAGRAEGLDPLLIYSVIRQESGFDPRAVSRAGARGLLQLMPATARSEAESLGWPELRPGAEFDVATNLRLGTHHMGRLFEQFPGSLPAALAAYNANPEKARQWQSWTGDPDVLIEAIGWWETRGYVKTVLRNLLRYRALY